MKLSDRINEYEILKMIEKEISMILDKTKDLEFSNIVGIGIAVSGLVLNDERLEISASLKWKGLSLKEYFEKFSNFLFMYKTIQRQSSCCIA